MPAYTKSEAEAELVKWKAALSALSSGIKSYTLTSGVTVTKFDLPMIRDQIDFFAREVDRASRSNRLPTWNVVPLDC